MWPFMSQKTVIITFPVVRADLNFFLLEKMCASIPCSAVSSQAHSGRACFIASDDSLQEGLSFFVKPIKMFPGNVKAVLLVLRCEHLGYPATAHLGKFEHFTIM